MRTVRTVHTCEYGVRGWNDSPDRMTPQSFHPREEMTPQLSISVHATELHACTAMAVWQLLLAMMSKKFHEVQVNGSLFHTTVLWPFD